METSILFHNKSEKEHDELQLEALVSSQYERKRSVAMIVAIATDGAIGNNGDLLWHISADLKRFKQLTTGHPVIMGRCTRESLPKGFLPNRRNLVITHDSSYTAPEIETFTSPEAAIAACDITETPFIIGGAQIYRHAINFVDKIFITEVMAEFPNADTRLHLDFSDFDIIKESEIFTDTESGLCYRFIDLVRRL